MLRSADGWMMSVPMVPRYVPLLVLILTTGHPFLSVCHAFTLITFDVDGTLVKGSGQAAEASAHSRAFGVAIGTVLGDGTPTPPVAQVLPREGYHGSTDGLILCRLAKATLGIERVSEEQLERMFDVMYEYIAGLEDEEIAKGIEVLPGVLETLQKLSTMKDQVACGLVTGNVEGIARRKMRAVGVLTTGALAAKNENEQTKVWEGSDDIAFLGGFGSDYSSRDILNPERNYLDRGEQIAIAARRCNHPELNRVVHVGDAPADVLAAKSFSAKAGDGISVGCVGVATGSFSANELKELAGEPIPGVWEPVVLENGIADPTFLGACGVVAN